MECDFRSSQMLLVAILAIRSGQGSLLGMERFAERHLKTLNQLLSSHIAKSPSDSGLTGTRAGLRPADLPLHELQRDLITDALAPSAIAQQWDSPWHHLQWLERQQAALGKAHLVSAAQSESSRSGAQMSDWKGLHERVWKGEFERSSHGSFCLSTDTGEQWPVITLEPSIHQWLLDEKIQRTVEVLGRLNPWAHWLCISGLLQSE